MLVPDAAKAYLPHLPTEWLAMNVQAKAWHSLAYYYNYCKLHRPDGIEHGHFCLFLANNFPAKGNKYLWLP